MLQFPVQHHIERLNEYFDTEVSVEYLPGCFMGSTRITAFDGEVVIYIHSTGGHFLNWCVVIMKCDTAPVILQGEKNKRDTKIADAVDAITAHFDGKDCTAWWRNAVPKIKGWFACPV